jgi:hypothetical protein
MVWFFLVHFSIITSSMFGWQTLGAAAAIGLGAGVLIGCTGMGKGAYNVSQIMC